MRSTQKNHAKIVCTIGPASDDLSVLRKLMQEGMDVARLNFSHGDHKEHGRRIQAIRHLNRVHRFSVKILQDLEGYRMRIGSFTHNRKYIALKKGQTVLLSNQEGAMGPGVIPFDYQGLLTDIKPKAHLYIDDGNIALVVTSGTKKYLKARVEVPGILKERKGINIPEFNVPVKGLTAKDEEDIHFGLKNKVDYLAQSFVRSKKDMEDIRDRVKDQDPKLKIIAKIENCQGIQNIDEILKIADGIMVARGDMGVSVPIYQVPMIQKMIIKKCNQRKKFVITATQMLESMTEHSRPTRAEVTDVANAILDGSDFVMLSGETAAGKYPVEAVRMMEQIILFTEASQKKHAGGSLRFISSSCS